MRELILFEAVARIQIYQQGRAVPISELKAALCWKDATFYRTMKNLRACEWVESPKRGQYRVTDMLYVLAAEIVSECREGVQLSFRNKVQK
jgi:DNA-binding IclR family transcriptional regulator